MSWTETTMEAYNEALASLPAGRRPTMAGWSPGYVAARLGITRQAVYAAINRNKLDAFRITRDGKMVAVIIAEASVLRYESSETRQKHTPKEYRATA